MSYLFLAIAVLFEVVGTTFLPMTQNFSRAVPTGFVFISYGVSFYLLTLALRDIPIAIVYATWSGMGVFLISCIGYFIYAQDLQWQAILGMALIVSGVILVNAFSTAH